jgi:ABC-type transporter Mla subunit MlaD
MRGSPVTSQPPTGSSASRSRLRPNSRIVGYGTAVAVVLFALFFSWRFFVYTQLERDYVWVHFTGNGDLIGSLQRDDPVAVQGVAIGQVEAIESARDGVRVRLRFWKHEKLYRDAHASNVGNGLMGMRFVLMEPGADSLHPLDRHADITGSFDPGIAEVMSRIEDVVAKVRNIRNTAHALAQGDAGTPPLHSVVMDKLDEADRLLGGLDRFDGKVRKAGTELTRLSRTSRTTTRALDSLQSRIASQLRSVDTILVQAQGLVVSLRGIARDADSSVQAIARPLEPLTRDDSLLRRIDASLGTLDAIEGFLDGKTKIKYHFHIWGNGD